MCFIRHSTSPLGVDSAGLYLWEFCRVPHLGVVDLEGDPLLPLALREETRQDTVRRRSRSCLLPPCRPEGEKKKTSGGSERKSKVTLKTIGPLPGHSAAECLSHRSPLQPWAALFPPPCLGHLRSEAGTRMSGDLETISQRQQRNCRVPTDMKRVHIFDILFKHKRIFALMIQDFF